MHHAGVEYLPPTHSGPVGGGEPAGVGGPSGFQHGACFQKGVAVSHVRRYMRRADEAVVSLVEAPCVRQAFHGRTNSVRDVAPATNGPYSQA